MRAPRKTISALGLVIANALPLWAYVTDRVGPADLLLVIWLESFAVGVVAFIRIVTAQGAGEPSGSGDRPAGTDPLTFFVVAYGGGLLFLGIFVRWIVQSDGLVAGFTTNAALVCWLAFGHFWALHQDWFKGDRRSKVSVDVAGTMPFPRLLLLWLATVMVGVLVTRFEDGTSIAGDSPIGRAAAVLVLCLLTLASDLDELYNDGRVYPGTFMGLGVGSAKHRGGAHRRPEE